MTLAFVALIAGLALLVWSADKFVDGAAATARYAGMPPLLAEWGLAFIPLLSERRGAP